MTSLASAVEVGCGLELGLQPSSHPFPAFGFHGLFHLPPGARSVCFRIPSISFRSRFPCSVEAPLPPHYFPIETNAFTLNFQDARTDHACTSVGNLRNLNNLSALGRHQYAWMRRNRRASVAFSKALARRCRSPTKPVTFMAGWIFRMRRAASAIFAGAGLPKKPAWNLLRSKYADALEKA